MSKLTTRTDTWKGYPTVVVTEDIEDGEAPKRIFSGGIKKAQALLDIAADPEALEAIKAFIESNKS